MIDSLFFPHIFLTVEKNDKTSGKSNRAALLGMGFDNRDGHKRVTRGENFILLGGSEETHARMTETSIKTMEELKRRHKSLESVSREELSEIIYKSTPN